MLHMPSEKKHDALAALRFQNFRRLVVGKFIGVVGQQMLGIAIGWELYERTSSAFSLGLVGPVQVLPIFLFVIPAGHVADHFRPKKVITLAQGLLLAASLSLALLSWKQGPLWA